MMKPSYLVDTDVLVDFFRGVEQAVAFVGQNSSSLVLSTIVIAELYAGARDEETTDLDDFFKLFLVYSVTPEIARSGGLLRRRYGKSHAVGLADALLAATAQQHGLALMTLNTKHFPMFADLKPAYRKR